ncbi:MAG: GNAT family N-acetyltransferase [Pseudomonadota bacterium]|nr:GNAT family N-acetyltransferase [Pseudomonadota bacterium]
MNLDLVTHIEDVPSAQWNGLTGTAYPFLRHEFLSALEASGAVCPDTGWQPLHVRVRSDTNELLALLPLYLKGHSYGEYVFDWSWAHAYQRHGLEYYPKLLSAVPFTPATGPRLARAPGVDEGTVLTAIWEELQQLCAQLPASSWHGLFAEPDEVAAWKRKGALVREGTQFHWVNQGYESFEGFLDALASRKRKNLRKERKRVADQGIVLERLTGPDIDQPTWSQFFDFYALTYHKRGQTPYLNLEFFLRLAESMPEQLMMVVARLGDQPVGAALSFQGADALYGRYWGCDQEYECLHFEACYYQGIEHCIEQGLTRFDPGAQGEHKIQRGFLPTTTHSVHWVEHPGFRDAIAQFLAEETPHVRAYAAAAEEKSPFRTAPSHAITPKA